MNIILIDFLVNNIGIIFTLIFLFYLCLLAVRMVKLYDIFRYLDKKWPHSTTSRVLPFLKEQFSMLLHACQKENTILIENRIEQLWIEYERNVQAHFSAMNGYIYSLILWGFTGTIWGTIKAFGRMGESLFEKDIQAAEALSAALQGGLNIALYTSLFAATLGAVMVTYIYSHWMYGKAKRLESAINDEMYMIIDNSSSKNVPVGAPMQHGVQKKADGKEELPDNPVYKERRYCLGGAASGCEKQSGSV